MKETITSNLLTFPQTRPSWIEVLRTVTSLKYDIRRFLSENDITHSSFGHPQTLDALFKIIMALAEEATDKYLARRTILTQLQRFAMIRVLDPSLASLDKSFAELEHLMQQCDGKTSEESDLLAA